MAISSLNELNPTCGIRNEIVISISQATASILAFIKILTIRLNREKMRIIVESILEDWATITTDDERGIMKNVARIGRMVCIYQMTSAFVSIVPMVLAGLENSTTVNPITNATEVIKVLPFPNPCSYNNLLSNFYVEIYIVQILQVVTTIFGNVGSDCYFFGLVMHLVGQVKCLAKDFENELGESNMKSVIRRHTHLLQLGRYLEEIFCLVTAVHVAGNIYNICLAGM